MEWFGDVDDDGDLDLITTGTVSGEPILFYELVRPSKLPLGGWVGWPAQRACWRGAGAEFAAETPQNIRFGPLRRDLFICTIGLFI